MKKVNSLEVSYNNKTFEFINLTVYELKQLTEYFYESHFFKKETLKFFGQTLKTHIYIKLKLIIKIA